MVGPKQGQGLIGAEAVRGGRFGHRGPFGLVVLALTMRPLAGMVTPPLPACPQPAVTAKVVGIGVELAAANLGRDADRAEERFDRFRP